MDKVELVRGLKLSGREFALKFNIEVTYSSMLILIIPSH